MIFTKGTLSQTEISDSFGLKHIAYF